MLELIQVVLHKELSLALQVAKIPLWKSLIHFKAKGTTLPRP